MSSLKKLAVALSVVALILAGCSSGKYTDKIDKAVKMQDKKQEKIAKHDTGDEVKHFDKKDANIYV
ncbi:cystatin-like fold lipoprotein, partial [Staphylococcus hominis]